MKLRHQTQITVWPAITDLMISIVVIAVLLGVVGYIVYNGEVNKLQADVIKQRGLIDTLQGSLKHKDAVIAGLLRAGKDNRDSIQGELELLQDSFIVVVEESRARAQGRIDSLYTSLGELQNRIDIQRRYIKALEDSIAKSQGDGLGSPSCLGLIRRGNPKPLMTIQAQPDNIYFINFNEPRLYIEGDFSAVERYINTIPDGRIAASQMIAHAGEIYRLIPELTPKKCIFYVRLDLAKGVSKPSLRLRWTNDLERYFGLTNPGIRW